MVTVTGTAECYFKCEGGRGQGGRGKGGGARGEGARGEGGGEGVANATKQASLQTYLENKDSKI